MEMRLCQERKGAFVDRLLVGFRKRLKQQQYAPVSFEAKRSKGKEESVGRFVDAR